MDSASDVCHASQIKFHISMSCCYPFAADGEMSGKKPKVEKVLSISDDSTSACPVVNLLWLTVKCRGRCFLKVESWKS